MTDSLLFAPSYTRPWSPAPFPCRRLDRDFLLEPAALKTLADRLLTAAERDFWDRLPIRGPRAREWLLGRVAAKEALMQWFQQEQGVSPTDFTLLPDAQGKPRLQGTLAPLPEVSISHSRGHILAAVAPTPLGVDLERLDVVRFDDWFHLAFGAEELALIPGRGPLLVGGWCAKEAAAKAWGTGFQGNPKDWVITSFTPDEITVQHGDQTFRVRLWYAAQEVVAWCQR
ncbi:4'-phosphopantetheinyl transferase family protein [Anthocerotibacter panamensis]|uniref:4'-phosphopantetheinyl transferase family protein n=1 Tax=Anthocerotibacter panamensis TaxID=2857077 RepID=UPI001C4043BE|nr:4'-phosphopantetheinyl transferase superfamily protein [Anthocerotibacter panamensis]